MQIGRGEGHFGLAFAVDGHGADDNVDIAVLKCVNAFGRGQEAEVDPLGIAENVARNFTGEGHVEALKIAATGILETKEIE